MAAGIPLGKLTPQEAREELQKALAAFHRSVDRAQSRRAAGGCIHQYQRDLGSAQARLDKARREIRRDTWPA